MSGWESEVLLEDALGLNSALSPCMCCQVNSQTGEFPMMYCEDCIWHMVDDSCITEERHDSCFPHNGCPVAFAADYSVPFPWEFGMARDRDRRTNNLSSGDE